MKWEKWGFWVIGDGINVMTIHVDFGLVRGREKIVMVAFVIAADRGRPEGLEEFRSKW